MFATNNYKCNEIFSDDDSLRDELAAMYDDVLFSHANYEDACESDTQETGWEAMNDNSNAIIDTEDDDDDNDDESVNSIYDTLFESAPKEEPVAPNQFMENSRRFESFATGMGSYDSNDLLSLNDDEESLQSMEDNIFEHKVIEPKKSRICSRRKMWNNSSRFESFATGMGSYDSNDLLSCDDSEDDLSFGSEDSCDELDLSGTFTSSLTKSVRRNPYRIPTELHLENDPNNISQSSKDSTMVDESSEPEMFDLSELELSVYSTTPTVAYTEVSSDS